MAAAAAEASAAALEAELDNARALCAAAAAGETQALTARIKQAASPSCFAVPSVFTHIAHTHFPYIYHPTFAFLIDFKQGADMSWYDPMGYQVCPLPPPPPALYPPPPRTPFTPALPRK